MFACLRRRIRACVVAASALSIAVLLAACGGGDAADTVSGVTVAGAGLASGPPPWPAQREGLAARIAALDLPKPGTERFHRHQLLHIYNDGLLVPVAADIGVDEARGIESGLHTHDASGVIHMEASKPFSATLGDLFRLWGVAFSPDRVGGLRAESPDDLQVFVNGARIDDPAAHVLAKNDNIVIAFGSLDGVPRRADETALRAANGKGGTPVPCSLAKTGKKQKSCFANGGP